MWRKVSDTPLEAPVVTGAFMVCRRTEFIELGGFCESYFYGYEDVDLCLKYIITKVFWLISQPCLFCFSFRRSDIASAALYKCSFAPGVSLFGVMFSGNLAVDVLR